MLPAGTFHAMAKSAQLSESGKGTPQVAVLFEVVDAEHAGWTITWYGFLTDAAMKRTLESLRNAGWRGTDIEDLSDLNRGDGPVVQLVVEHEEWQGQTRAKVKWVNRGGAAVTPLDAQKVKSLGAKVRAAALALDQEQRGSAAPAVARGAQRPPQASRAPEPPPHSDDDAPPPF